MNNRVRRLETLCQVHKSYSSMLGTSALKIKKRLLGSLKKLFLYIICLKSFTRYKTRHWETIRRQKDFIAIGAKSASALDLERVLYRESLEIDRKNINGIDYWFMRLRLRAESHLPCRIPNYRR